MNGGLQNIRRLKMAIDLKSQSSMSSLIVIIGAIIGIASVFITWYSVSDFGFTYSMTGWDIYSQGKDFNGGYFIWMPLLTLIFSVIALLSGLVYFAVRQKAINLISILFGILIIVAAILYATYSSDGDSLYNYLGIGVYLAIISGLLVIISGALASKAE